MGHTSLYLIAFHVCILHRLCNWFSEEDTLNLQPLAVYVNGKQHGRAKDASSTYTFLP